MNKTDLKTAEEQNRRSCFQGKPCLSEMTLKILALGYKREITIYLSPSLRQLRLLLGNIMTWWDW